LYSRAGATLLLPSQGITPRPQEGKYVCYAGWSCSPRAPDVSTHGGRRGAQGARTCASASSSSLSYEHKYVL
jgi:hypothetical protein